MSAKQQLSEAIATIPESATLEEAFQRLYKAFKEKMRREATSPTKRRPLGLDAGKGYIADDFDAPLPEDIQRLFQAEG